MNVEITTKKEILRYMKEEIEKKNKFIFELLDKQNKKIYKLEEEIKCLKFKPKKLK